MATKKLKIYIAGPYTIGDVAINVRNAIDAGNVVLKSGHIPFIPHLTHFWHLIFPGPYEQWTTMDLEWLPVCDALIRLPGESSGADAEVLQARELGMAIYSMEEFIEAVRSRIL